jgi:DNA-binding transcriptional ArsR family regulator
MATTNNRSHAPHRPSEIDKYVDDFLSTVCDTSRRYILELLAEPNEGSDALPEWRSGDIARAIGLSPATTSEHLRQLMQAGLLNSRRQGNTVHYQLCNHMLVKAFRDLIIALDRDYATRLTPNQ